MARLTIDDDQKPDNSMEILEHYEDRTGAPGLQLRIDLKGQKDYLHFYLSKQDALQLVKRIIDIVS